MKQHVVYIGGFELPDKNAAAHRVISNGKALRALGYDVTYIGVSREQSDVTPLESGRKVQGFDSYSIRYPISKQEWLRYLTRIDMYLDIMDKVDSISHVVLYNFPAIPLLRMLRLCKKRRIRCYADVTEWYSARGQGPVYAVVKGFDTFLRMRILHRMCDGLIVISKYLFNYYYKCSKILIPPLVDASEQKWSNAYVKGDETLRLAYAGSPGKKDRIDLLIDSLSHVSRDTELDIVGISLDDYISNHPEHRDFIVNDAEKIRFHGRVSHLEALEYVKRANYSCFFRTSDRVCMAGFPTKFVEAITSSTPVLTNNDSDLAEYDDGFNVLMVPSIDSDTISRFIERIPSIFPVERTLFDYRKYVCEFKKLF